MTVLASHRHDPIDATGRFALEQALVQRLVDVARWPQGVVSPTPALLRGIWLQLQREDAAADLSPLRLAALNLLATAMRRRTALQASLVHVDGLSRLSNADVVLLRDLAARRPALKLTRMELRCDVLRDGDAWPRRVPLVADAAPRDNDAGREASSPTTALERLSLVSWADRTLVVADAPDAARLRRAMRRGNVSLAEGLRRWLVGQHMATVLPNEMSGPSVTKVGNIALDYRTLSLTTAGQALAIAIQGPR